MTITTLALSDSWLIAIVVINVLVNFVTLFISMAAKRSADETSELRSDVKKHAEDAVEQKFNVVREQLMGEIRLIAQDVRQAKDRLKSGDRLLNELRDRDHRDEIKTLQAVEELRRDVMELTATKTELRRVEDKHDQLATKVAKIQGAA